MLPTDSKERKRYPVYEGFVKYFPDAIAAVANLSFEGNEKHNPGEKLHWAKEKSADHQDCVVRHMIDALEAEEAGDTKRQEEELKAEAWRAMAALQTFYDKTKGKPVLRQPVGFPIRAGGDVAGKQPDPWTYVRVLPEVPMW